MKATGYVLATVGLILLVPQAFVETPWQLGVALGVAAIFFGGLMIADAGVREEGDHEDVPLR